MRLFNHPAPVLAVILSFLAEGLVFLITKLFGIVGVGHFSALQDFWYQLNMWFYLPAARFAESLAEAHLVPRALAMGLFYCLSVFQWWLIFCAGILMLRHFQRKPDEE